MPADKGVRLDDRQRIANFREQPIETNEYHSVDGAEGEFLWSSSPQNVNLLPQRPDLCLKHYPRPDQIDNHPTNEPAKIPHWARSSSDSRSTAKQDKVCDRDSHCVYRRRRLPLPAMLADVLSGSMLSKKCPAVIGFAVGEAFWLYSWLGVAAVFADRYRQGSGDLQAAATLPCGLTKYTFKTVSLASTSTRDTS